jgi:hypothetical protein
MTENKIIIQVEKAINIVFISFLISLIAIILDITSISKT